MSRAVAAGGVAVCASPPERVTLAGQPVRREGSAVWNPARHHPPALPVLVDCLQRTVRSDSDRQTEGSAAFGSSGNKDLGSKTLAHPRTADDVHPLIGREKLAVAPGESTANPDPQLVSAAHPAGAFGA